MSPQALMQLALDQASLALTHDEVPIGAVIYHVPTARIIAAAHNRRILDKDPTAHAEILAIRQAAGVMGEECARLLTSFFASKRAMGKK